MIRKTEFTKDSEIAEATATLEMQIQSLEKKLQNNLMTVKGWVYK